MIRKSAFALALAASAVMPHGVEAQRLGIGGRVGSLGVGPEVAVGLGERVVVRGGMGLMPVEPSITLSDIDVTFELPSWYTVGVDVYVTGAMRLGAGFLFKSDDPRFTGVFTSDQDIGGQTFTPQEIGTLVAVIDSEGQVPYVLLGFGNHTAPGVGLFLDLGVAFLGAPDFRLSTEGGTLPDDSGALRTALDAEAAEFEQDAGRYLELWPILSLGIRIGIG